MWLPMCWGDEKNATHAVLSVSPCRIHVSMHNCRERERQTDRPTDRQRDRDRQTDSQTDRQRLRPPLLRIPSVPSFQALLFKFFGTVCMLDLLPQILPFQVIWGMSSAMMSSACNSIHPQKKERNKCPEDSVDVAAHVLG